MKYDQPQNELFCEKIESVQYKATLGITAAIQSTSRDRIYQELGLESLKSRRWYKRLVCMFKIMNEKAPNYLINLIPKYEPTIRTRNNSIPSYKCRTNCFKHSFFSFYSKWLVQFRYQHKKLRANFLIQVYALSFIRPSQNSIYNISTLKNQNF